MPKMRNLLHLLLTGAFLLSGCAAPTPAATPTAIPVGRLTVSLLYPTGDSDVEMGQTIKAIVQVTDEQELPIADANVTVTFSDPSGQVIGNVPASFGDGNVYRSDSWTVPHHMQEGNWSIQVEAVSSRARGVGNGQVKVDYSTSEVLYHKYGFWLDAPTLRGIVPFIGAERGDAQNGLIRWGGQILSQHVLPENWVEVHWLKGSFALDSPEAVRAFLLDEVGDLGFTPVREIGTFQRTKFKRWEAWVAPARGQYYYQEVKWTVFYAPEVDETYAISTTVIYPPEGIDANEVLLENFDIDPNVQADGVAPEPLVRLLPQPTLIGPEIATRYTGLEQPIVLSWQPLKELAADEYYQVAVDYNYEETNFLVKYATRETQFTLPEALYRQPNCSVFSWRITLMQQTGADKDGKPVGKALSYNSLYHYLQWLYPSDEKAPFNPLCPNAQF